MSIWTHVVGSIRMDGIPGILPESCKERLLKVLGPMDTFNEPNDASTLPRGSEGSLRYEIIEYGTGLPWVIIPIWGDLRSYEDLPAIEKWFDDLLEKLGGMVRDAVLFVRCGNGTQAVFTSKKKESV